MKRYLHILCLALALAFACEAGASISAVQEKVKLNRINGGKELQVSAEISLDSLKLKGNEQIFLTPVVTGEKGEEVILPTILLTGRNMHYAYERGTMRGLKEFKKKYNIIREVQRENGKPQTLKYFAAVPMQPWMRTEHINVRFMYDNCGCGVFTGTGLGDPTDTLMNPVKNMYIAYINPRVTELPVSIHEGRARVQFEVNRTELHDNPYKCRNGQRIDNRQQLKVIYDSIEYALTDPNVEIAKIEIIGYASPESPYEHNRVLATGRSRALAEYIGNYVGSKYQIPANITSFDAVPENWVEFREQVVKATDITDAQRADLLELIDRPAFLPSDYDAKERELQTSPKFKDLYRSKILPEWFPHLRATKFRISTRLKPMDDQRLAEIITVSPEKMSLNQMMRVAWLYPEGSEDFNRVIDTALRYYPESEEANLNAAATALRSGDYDRADAFLKKSGDSPEAVNARAIIAAHKGDFGEARRLLETIDTFSEAQKNLLLLGDE
ncbi:MAG: DUF3868 domain-containing protein [Muribaculaceae bacterium]|nr:DUF3868 domain-containing protein [Muribaculaceae bacterium]MDE6027012.1 DUF3868 domain-containing protein [Muribaculaceae bacterium]